MQNQKLEVTKRLFNFFYQSASSSARPSAASLTWRTPRRRYSTPQCLKSAHEVGIACCSCSDNTLPDGVLRLTQLSVAQSRPPHHAQEQTDAAEDYDGRRVWHVLL